MGFERELVPRKSRYCPAKPTGGGVKGSCPQEERGAAFPCGLLYLFTYSFALGPILCGVINSIQKGASDTGTTAFVSLLAPESPV